jgi:hypothetical protein
LTDSDYTILSLLRSHKFEENAKIAVKQKYPFSHAASLTVNTIETDPEKIKLLIEPEISAEEKAVMVAEAEAEAEEKKKEAKAKKTHKVNKPEPTPK